MAEKTNEESDLDGSFETPRAIASTKPFPLNSKRMKADWLQRLAKELELPTSASTDELRQMIDGKLLEIGREPPNVQVLVVTPEGGGADAIKLRDETGIFLEAREQAAFEEPGGLRVTEGPEESESDSVEALRDVLVQAKEREASLLGRLETIQRALEEEKEKSTELQAEKERLEGTLVSPEEVSDLRTELASEKDKVKRIWRLNCEQLATHDSECSSKDTEIVALKARISELETSEGASPAHVGSTRMPLATSLDTSFTAPSLTSTLVKRRGKAPPVDAYTGENPEIRFEDWLPTLSRAATWNSWSSGECLMQLAGHLRGKALQEWNLLSSEDMSTYETATRALRKRLDPQNRVLAAQDFRHALQGESESVADYIRRLERHFQIAYGSESLTTETRETMLHGQLQEGLRYDIMKSPAVSGALSYSELCVSAKHEEKRAAELKRRQQYLRGGSSQAKKDDNKVTSPKPSSQQASRSPRKCYGCGSLDHLAKECKVRKKESVPYVSHGEKKTNKVTTNVIHSQHKDEQQDSDDPLDYLYSSDSEGEGEVRLVQVEDKGSKPRKAHVGVQGVPAYGVIDTGADITIMGGELFKKVAAAARLKKRCFKQADKTPYSYDQRPFKLNGKIDL